MEKPWERTLKEGKPHQNFHTAQEDKTRKERETPFFQTATLSFFQTFVSKNKNIFQDPNKKVMHQINRIDSLQKPPF